MGNFQLPVTPVVKGNLSKSIYCLCYLMDCSSFFKINLFKALSSFLCTSKIIDIVYSKQTSLVY